MRQCKSCKGSGWYMRPAQKERRPYAGETAEQRKEREAVRAEKRKEHEAILAEREAIRAERAAIRASRTFPPLEELEARKIDRKLQDIDRIRAKVASGAKVEKSQLQKMQQRSVLEQSRVMQKIASGWSRDLRPQSELIQEITLSAEEEMHARRFERKISKLAETQAKLRSAIKVDHVQLEALQKEIDLLSQKAVLQKIAAGFRRCVLDNDTAKPAAPAKMHSSLAKSKVQSPEAPAASQSLERSTEAVVVQETKVESDEVDSASEVSTVDTVDATQAAAIEKAALLLKAAGLPGLTAEQLRAFAAQTASA